MAGQKGRSGGRKMPIEPRIRRGTVKPQELAKVETITVDGGGLPKEPIRPLGPAGLASWNRLVDIVWIDSSDSETAQAFCELVDERQLARTNYLADPENAWRSAVASRAIEKSMLPLLAMLGLSPSGRASMGLALSRANRNTAEVAALTVRNRAATAKTITGPDASLSGAGR